MRILRPGSYMFTESAVRNTLYLWLVSGIVSLGNDYATAWAIFNTIRWGLVMVPVNSLEASSSTFVGHAWGAFKARLSHRSSQHATATDLVTITRPAILSFIIALTFEVPLCLLMTFVTARPFAYYLSQSDAVADITTYMWRTIDWCYIFYAVSTQMATILLATKPRWYLAQSLASNLLWTLPWAIVIQVHGLHSGDPWFWYAVVFGGSLVVSFFIIAAALGGWVWMLTRRRTGGQ